MKKAAFVLAFCLLLVYFSGDLGAGFDAGTLYVKAMTVNIRINRDTSLDVEEKLTVNFPDNYGKDVFEWYIAKSYEIGEDRTRKNVAVKKITDDLNGKYDFDENGGLNGSRLSIRKNSGNYSGESNIRIEYTVSGSVEAGSDYDLIKWPVVAKEQKIPIAYSNVYVNSPYAETADASCFAGDIPSGQRLCLSEYDKNQIRFYTTGTVGNGKEFLFQVGIKKSNTLKYPGVKDRFVSFIINNIETLGLLALAMTGFLVFLVWLTRNKKITIKIRKRSVV